MNDGIRFYIVQIIRELNKNGWQLKVHGVPVIKTFYFSGWEETNPTFKRWTEPGLKGFKKKQQAEAERDRILSLLRGTGRVESELPDLRVHGLIPHRVVHNSFQESDEAMIASESKPKAKRKKGIVPYEGEQVPLL